MGGFKYIESGSGGYVAKTPKVKRKEEYILQRPIVKILRRIEDKIGSLTFFHVPNQLLRKSSIRKIYYALGARAGVTDLVIPIHDGKTIWIELKYGKNTPDDDQVVFHEKLRSLGHSVESVSSSSSKDAIDQVLKILEKHGVRT